MVFTFNEEHQCYEIKEGPTDSEGNRPIPYKHFTREALMKCGFFPVTEKYVEECRRKCDEHYKNL
tara:strand:+ start:4852 stop:5046 length:195 start_codon:yes stop_codon:yes gene_type:complete